MNSSILFVVLMIFVRICKPEDEPNTTVIVQDTRTEMTIQEFDDPLKRSRSDDYYDRLNEAEGEDDDLDFDYDDGDGQDVAGKLGVQKQEKQTKEQLMQEALLSAMKKPAIKEQIGQVIPILRVMTPTQRLTLAALVSSQIMSHNGLNEANLTQIASMFAGKNVENADDRHNVTEHLLLPISMDIAKMFRGLGREVGRNLRHDNIPPGPFNQFIIRTKPKRLIKRPYRTKPPGFNRRSDNHIPLDRNMTLSPLSPPPLPSPPPSQNLTPPSPPPTQSTLTTSMSSSSSTSSFSNSSRPLPSSPSPSPPTPSPAPVAEALKQPSIDDCEYFSNSLCLEVTNYPVDAILSSIKNQKNIMETLLADFKTQSADEMVEGVTSQQENKYQPQHYFSRANRRQDGQNNNEIRDFGAEGGYMCPSSVKYARPKRARTTQGDWKYIVNAGDYTQTLRLEMCLKPLASCSYVTDHFKSQCTQVFNYHRLLTWDEKKGLHMDIFKVPSCCSCHIQGYASLFPPNNDYTFAEKRREPLPVNEFPPPNPPQRPIFNNVGGKREVPRPIQQAPHSPTFHPEGPIQNQFRQPEPIQGQFRPQDPTQNLVDHLVPPGPPLPLDERNNINNYNDLSLDASSYNKRGPVEYNRRHPAYHDENRPHNRVVDRVEVGQQPDGSNYGSKVRNNKKPGLQQQQQQHLSSQQQNLPPQPPPPQFRPSLNIPQKPRIVAPTKLPQNTNSQYGNQQNRFSNFQANQNSPKLDVKTSRPDQSLFVTPSPNNELVIQPGSKPNPHQPVKYFNPDINEIPQQNKNPFLVSPSQNNKVVFKENDNSVYTAPPTTTTTTARVPLKSETVSASGQKRVNYNYHPIIDFFTVESTSKASVSFPTPMNHEWTPVIGRSGA